MSGALFARARGALGLLLVAVLLGAALLADALAAPERSERPERVAQSAATAGTWWCPITAGEGEQAVLSIAAATDVQTAVTVVRYADGTPSADPPVGIGPGDQLDVVLPPEESTSPVAVRWEGGPAVVTYRVDGERVAAAPCAEGPSPTWYVSGLDTAEGSRSLLHVFNPYSVDAVASVAFATPGGETVLVRTENVVVEAGRHRVLDLGEFVPEEPDLTAVVRVRSGRLFAAGEVVYDRVTGATEPVGRTFVPGAPETGRLLGTAFARADDSSSSWLTVTNPSDREAAVEVRVSDPQPDAVLLGQATVPAGGARRIDLGGLATQAEFGVIVESVNEADIVVTRTTAIRTPDNREGVATSLAAAPTTTAVLAGGGTDDRSGRVSVYNPGPEAVRVDLRSGAGQTPPEWSGIEVGPNQRIAVELEGVGADLPGVPVAVTATGPVIAELRTFATSGALRLWTEVAVAESRWTGPLERPALRRDASLATTPLSPLDSADAQSTSEPLTPVEPPEPDGGTAPSDAATAAPDDESPPPDAASPAEPSEPSEEQADPSPAAPSDGGG